MMEDKFSYKINGTRFDGDYIMQELSNCEVKLEMSFVAHGIQMALIGSSYFRLLQKIRKEVAERNVSILCNGASRNVYPSAMQEDMGNGERAYRMHMGKHAKLEDIIEIMDYDEDHYIESSVEEQDNFFKRWILSKKKLVIRQPKYSIQEIKPNSKFFFLGKSAW